MRRRELFKLASGALAGISGKDSAFAGSWQKIGGSLQVAVGVRRPLPHRGLTFANPNRHSFAVRSDGATFLWGQGAAGALGAGATSNRSLLVQLTGVDGALALSCGLGGGLTAVVGKSGALFSAGWNSTGGLGDGTTIDRSTFVLATGISNVIECSAGTNFCAAIRSDGLVYTTGDNGFGQLGDGTITAKSTFAAVTGISSAVSVASGLYGMSALRVDGQVFATGMNAVGCIGIGIGGGFGDSQSTFVAAIGISNAIAISAGALNTFALRADGQIFSTGGGVYGVNGDNSYENRYTYVEATGISQAIAVAARWRTVHALRSDGLVFGCGYNGSGDIGDGSISHRSTFVQVVGLSQIVAIGPGAALRSDGKLFTVGSNAYGQLGDGTTINRSSFVQVQI
jgi:alpha-tubulin suppressor-like RCC1 family protein